MHSIKSRGYIVHTDEGHVSVEHRASFRPRTIMLMSVVYLCYCLLPAVRSVLADCYRSHDPVAVVFALFILLIPIMSGFTLFFFASGEVMRCDAREIHFAKRRTWGRWHRFRFASQEVREIHLASRGGGRARYYTVLSFQHGKRNYDMLEDMDSQSSARILKALAGMGLDAYEDRTKMPSYKLSLRSDLP